MVSARAIAVGPNDYRQTSPQPGDGRVDGPAAAAFLTATGHPISAATIRVWAHRGLVERRGQDHKGRTLYDLAELEARARHADRSRAG